MTDQELLALDHITAADASAYLGIPPQGCRALARSGKIGERIGATNRVMYQPLKMIRFKRGDDEDERLARLEKLIREMGVSDLCAKITAAIVAVVEREGE